MSYRLAAVFNAADLVGAELSALIERRRVEAVGMARPEPERLAQAKAVLGAWPVPLQLGGDRACSLPAKDQTLLPARAAFRSTRAYCASWAHEVVHRRGHVSRLERELSVGYSSDAYGREQLVVELRAESLRDRLEVGNASENHAAYPRHWVRLLRETPGVLFQLLGEAGGGSGFGGA